MVSDTIPEEKPTFTDLMRVRLKGLIDPIGGFLNRLGIKPNTITLMGLVGHIVGAYFLMQGRMTTGGIIIALLGPLDALDGTMARLLGEPSKWGAFVDSVVDRYSELFLFRGLLIHFYNVGDSTAVILVYLAISGSILVSYVRSRALALGFEVKVGMFSRLERYLVLVPVLILNIPVIGMWILAVGAQLTAVQRILAMKKQAYTPPEKS
jgi:CDP-diacylglycerol--glycerol-3-phosphate 3-phosphatidyltransferase